MNTQKNIAIIGAGIAGLTVALKLQQSGANVTVFEKSRGVAGRMSTRRQAANTLAAPLLMPFECDHGAPYFTATDSAFMEELADWQDNGVASLWIPRLKIVGQPHLDNQATENALRYEMNVKRYVGTPRMTSPAQRLAKSLITPVGLSTTIVDVKLHADGLGWVLISQEQGEIGTKFDVVLFAIPAPQASTLLKKIAPHFASIANATPMLGAWALMLHGEDAKHKSTDIDAAILFNSPLKWAAREASKPYRAPSNTWCLLASNSWSNAHIEAAAEDVAEVLFLAFESIGGIRSTEWTAHRWRYAVTAKMQLPPAPSSPTFPPHSPPIALLDAMWDGALGVGVCGDWCHSRHAGTVEGAWLSARALANSITTSW